MAVPAGRIGPGQEAARAGVAAGAVAAVTLPIPEAVAPPITLLSREAACAAAATPGLDHWAARAELMRSMFEFE